MKYIKTFLISVFMLLILVSPTALANTSIPVMVDNESSTVLVNTSTSSKPYCNEIPVLTYNETFGFIQSYINYLSEPLPGYTKSVTLTAVSNRPDGTVTYLETRSESFIKNGSILFKPNIQFGNCSQYYSNRSWYDEYYYIHPFNPDATDKMSVTLYQNYLVIYDVNLNREYDHIDLNVKNGILYGTSRQDPSIVYLITLQKVEYSIVK